MKILEKTFVMNADKSGNHTFTQLRREANVALYQRQRMDGSIFGYEVFFVKTVKAGGSLPGGGTVIEDYEAYPGGGGRKSKGPFGQTAWFITGPEAKERANQRFEQLLMKNQPVVEDETEETELVNVAHVSQPKIVQSKGDRRALKWPVGPFTQKQLAAHNGIDNYKEVYTDLQRALGNGTLKVSEQVHEVNRGRAAKMFELVAVAQPVTA